MDTFWTTFFVSIGLRIGQNLINVRILQLIVHGHFHRYSYNKQEPIKPEKSLYRRASAIRKRLFIVLVSRLLFCVDIIRAVMSFMTPGRLRMRSVNG